MVEVKQRDVDSNEMGSHWVSSEEGTFRYDGVRIDPNPKKKRFKRRCSRKRCVRGKMMYGETVVAFKKGNKYIAKPEYGGGVVR